MLTFECKSIVCILFSCLLRRGLFRQALVYIYDKMEILVETLRNIFAVIVSVGTLAIMFMRYLNRERLQHAKQVSEIIEKTAMRVFTTTALEHRVKMLEDAEKANQEYMRESFSQLNSRLDQIYSIIASLKQ
jgi:hypothetical protein